MARKAPVARASSRIPAQMVTTGTSKKPSMPSVKKPMKSNLGSKVKRTSDRPLSDSDND